VLAEGDEIGVGEFPQIAMQIPDATNGPAMVAPDAGTASPAPAAMSAPLILDEGPAITPGDEPAAPRAAPADALLLLDAAGNVRPLDELEAAVIRFAIGRYQGQMSEVARRLRIGRSTLYRKLDEIGLGVKNLGEGEAENVAAE
jgi:DNA-binding NtrC family response regulator